MKRSLSALVIAAALLCSLQSIAATDTSVSPQEKVAFAIIDTLMNSRPETRIRLAEGIAQAYAGTAQLEATSPEQAASRVYSNLAANPATRRFIPPNNMPAKRVLKALHTALVALLVLCVGLKIGLFPPLALLLALASVRGGSTVGPAEFRDAARIVSPAAVPALTVPGAAVPGAALPSSADASPERVRGVWNEAANLGALPSFTPKQKAAFNQVASTEALGVESGFVIALHKDAVQVLMQDDAGSRQAGTEFANRWDAYRELVVIRFSKRFATHLTYDDAVRAISSGEGEPVDAPREVFQSAALELGYPRAVVEGLGPLRTSSFISSLSSQTGPKQ